MSSGVLEEGVESNVDNGDDSDYAILKVRAKDWLVESTSEETQERNNNNACNETVCNKLYTVFIFFKYKQ